MTGGPVLTNDCRCCISEIGLLLSARCNGPGQMRFLYCGAVADTSCHALRDASGGEKEARRQLRGLLFECLLLCGTDGVAPLHQQFLLGKKPVTKH